VLFSMSVLIFAVVHIVPGNVAYAILGEYATPASDRGARGEARSQRSAAAAILALADGMLHGDLGRIARDVDGRPAR
jgi:peptide/nickel transport system permease protein